MTDNEAIGTTVIDRIRTLWGYRAWYAKHTGWIVQEKVDNERELRYLIALARKARRLAAVESADPITAAKALRFDDEGTLIPGEYPDPEVMPYHDWQADPNVEGMPEFNGAFR